MKVIDTLTQEDFHGAFQKFLERYKKGIAAGRDYFEGDYSFMCVLSIKVPIRKSLETYLMILVCVKERMFEDCVDAAIQGAEEYIKRVKND